MQLLKPENVPTVESNSTDYVLKTIEGEPRRLLKHEIFSQFGTPLLGLGDITRRATTTDAIAAIFDLQGFSNFCKQLDPQLAVPIFLNEFLAWLMDQIREQMAQTRFSEGITLHCPLPFFVKFMGDGLLVLWDASEASEAGRRNMIISCWTICRNYVSRFHKEISQKVLDAPPVLRCGIARGVVYSVGHDKDYVGSCINMAAKIQKLPGATFAFDPRGFALDQESIVDFFKTKVLTARTAVQGIGENELVGMLKDEYERMAAAEKRQFAILG